eukprot:7910365-Lingulodinium_polyedra.AAC.1
MRASAGGFSPVRLRCRLRFGPVPPRARVGTFGPARPPRRVWPIGVPGASRHASPRLLTPGRL